MTGGTRSVIVVDVIRLTVIAIRDLNSYIYTVMRLTVYIRSLRLDYMTNIHSYYIAA